MHGIAQSQLWTQNKIGLLVAPQNAPRIGPGCGIEYLYQVREPEFWAEQQNSITEARVRLGHNTQVNF